MPVAPRLRPPAASGIVVVAAGDSGGLCPPAFEPLLPAAPSLMLPAAAAAVAAVESATLTLQQASSALEPELAASHWPSAATSTQLVPSSAGSSRRSSMSDISSTNTSASSRDSSPGLRWGWAASGGSSSVAFAAQRAAAVDVQPLDAPSWRQVASNVAPVALAGGVNSLTWRNATALAGERLAAPTWMPPQPTLGMRYNASVAQAAATAHRPQQLRPQAEPWHHRNCA